jgi:signal transduction histidine kinase
VNRGTVRVRLTALYSGLFLATSTILLVVVNLLLRNMLQQKVTMIWRGEDLGGSASGETLPAPVQGATGVGPGDLPPGAVAGRVAVDVRDAVLRFQWGVTAVTIVVLTLVSIAVGWWLAGRVLSPLHQITATARRLSLSNLHERIALQGPRDELKDLADTFDTMLGRLERSAEGQRRFVANASHELRTPLAIQRTAIEIGLDNPTPERLAEVRQDLLTVNRRTERLLDGLLTLAQGEGGLEVREPTRLDAVVRQVAAATPNGDLDVHLDLEPVTVVGDPVLLERLVANLLDNAVRYNQPGGDVRVTLARTGMLTVRNTGPEVPPERVAEMFEPFRRLHRARTGPAEGAGLGLSIVRSIAQAHDATGNARAQPGGGLLVVVNFPAVTSPGRPPATSAAPARPAALAATPARPEPAVPDSPPRSAPGRRQ